PYAIPSVTSGTRADPVAGRARMLSAAFMGRLLTKRFRWVSAQPYRALERVTIITIVNLLFANLKRTVDLTWPPGGLSEGMTKVMPFVITRLGRGLWKTGSFDISYDGRRFASRWECAS